MFGDMILGPDPWVGFVLAATDIELSQYDRNTVVAS